jgi:riboflavin kinase/FMN adenylyltransferase
MHVVHGIDQLSTVTGPLFIVVGVFDGLHLGHAYLLRHLVAEAHARSARPTVVTFDAHPDEILTGSAPPLLLDPDERVRLLAEAGVDVLAIVHFDEALRQTPYDAFVRGITHRVAVAGFLMTPDAAFGYERRGTPDALADLGRSSEPAFDVVVIPPFEVGGRQIRSSAIRTAISSGDLTDAWRLLGRPYALVGTVDRRDGASVVRFEPPRALPPDGRWPAEIGPWPSSDAGDVVIATVAIGDGFVVVPATVSGDRVRVTLLGSRIREAAG